MEKTFNVDIITPDKKFLSVDSLEVVVPSYDGLITILRDHIPIITFLRPGMIKIKKNEELKHFYVEEGTVEFLDNNLLILTSTAKELSEIDKRLIDTWINEANKRINDVKVSDKEKYLLSYKIDTLNNIIK